jgi:hypothetical protein
MTLREMLQKDFGVDLPITGGLGQSADDAIKLNTQDPDEAAQFQLEIARCIYGLQGWYWRQVERVSAAVAGRVIEKFSSEVKYTEDDKIVTEKRNLYFDLSLVDTNYGPHLENPPISVGPLTSVNLPRQLGWFHFDSLTNNETYYPGLGVSVGYSAPSAKMTIYAYDKGLRDEIQVRPYESAYLEYIQAIADFRSMNPEARPVQEQEQDGARLTIFETNDILSIVLVAPYQDIFLKFRLTLNGYDEQYVVDCVMHTVSDFLSIVRRSCQSKH